MFQRNKSLGKMKLRYGFISNSSSSSFVIFKKYLTEEQKKTLLSYNNKEIEHEGGYDETWQISETEDAIVGDTFMDNDILLGMIAEMEPPIPFKAVNWNRDG